jgi:phosphopantetheinyl transferase
MCRARTPTREYEHFGGAPGADDLLRLWARKEAVIKARGEGSYVAVGEIDVLDSEIDGGWLCHDIPEMELADWPGFHAAVVFRDRPDLRAQPPGLVLTVRDFEWP